MGLFKNRKFEIDILVIFLFLITMTSAIIITFTYEKNHRSILEYSRRAIDQTSALIMEKIQCLFSAMEKLAQISLGVVKRHPEVSYENPSLVAHSLDEVKYSPFLYGFFVASPEGNYLGTLNLAVSGVPSFAKTMPPDTAFIMEFIDAVAKPPKEVWYYYDKEEKLLSSEQIFGRDFDAKSRPWYIGATRTKKLFWTDVFTFAPTEQTGVTGAIPVYNDNEEKQLSAIIGVNITLETFSQFLEQQKIGKSGAAFILNSSGNVILPLKSSLSMVVPVAYEQFLKDKKNDLTVDYNNKKYLVSITSFPSIFNENWQVVVIVPFLDYFSEIVKTQHQVVLISIAVVILAGIVTIFSAKRISKPIVVLAHEINKIQQLDLSSKVRIYSNIREIRLLDLSIAAMRNAIRSFSCYVPKEIVKKLIQKEHEIALGGEKREITLFFSDITGLTPIAETLPLDTLNVLLAEYFDGLSKVILKDFGTIDKYIGDSVMAFWNAPDDLPDHAAKGCVAALECQEFVTHFNETQKKQSKPELKTRIGINSGEVIAGNIGTKERMNYTVIGDVVNTTERLQYMNKFYHTKIILGEEVVRRIGERFLTRPLDFAELKGRKEKMGIYELMAIREKATAEEKRLASLFTKAYEAYYRGGFSEAKGLFEEIRHQFPEDAPTQIYLARIKSSLI